MLALCSQVQVLPDSPSALEPRTWCAISFPAFFIIFEDQFSVGDYIRTSGVEGFVEEVGIRTCKVKSWTGEVHILPNGNVTQVTNFSIHNSVAVVDVSIAYEEDIAQAEQVILELMKELPARYEAMLDVPELLGVQTLGASDVVMRIIADTQPMEHWAMARAIRKEVKPVWTKEELKFHFHVWLCILVKMINLYRK